MASETSRASTETPGSSTRWRRSHVAAWLNSANGPSACVHVGVAYLPCGEYLRAGIDSDTVPATFVSALWVPMTSSMSCDLGVFVDDAAEAVAPPDLELVQIRRLEESPERAGLLKHPVWSMPIVMIFIVRHGDFAKDLTSELPPDDNDAPMTIVLDAVEETVTHPFAVFWVDGGLPENYSLPSLTPAVVVFNSRYLQLAAYLRFVLTEDTITTDVLAEITERACLEIMAELTLRYGDPAVACSLMAKSVIGGGDEWTLAPSMQDIENATIDERYMAFWFFALAHELGHIHVEHTDDTDPVVTRPYLDRLVDKVMARMLGDAYGPGRDALARGVMYPSLHWDALSEEVRADRFAVDVLRIATQRVMQQTGPDGGFSMHRFVAENLQMFRLFHHMNRCARVAAMAANASPEAVPDLAGSMAFNVRLNVLVDYLAQILAVDDSEVDGVREMIQALGQGNVHGTKHFSRGSSRRRHSA